MQNSQATVLSMNETGRPEKGKKKRVPSFSHDGGDGGRTNFASPSKKRARTESESDDDEDEPEEEDQEQEEEDIERTLLENNDFEEEDVDDKNSRISKLLETFTPEQHRRYEHYRRSHFDRKNIAQMVNTVAQEKTGDPSTSVSHETGVTMAGVTKLFVGEVIEGARVVMEERSEKGPIHPRHIQESYQRLFRAGKIPYLQPKSRILR